MFGQFYNSSLRSYVLMMGDLFSHVKVIRQRGDNTYIQAVPITYGSKERFMIKLNNKINSINNADGPAKVETILPRINLHLVDLVYNSQYKTSTLNRRISQQKTGTGTVSQYSPTPVKMMFELGIYTRHQDDMFQIVEQIMPYFQPHFNTKLTELIDNDISFERDVRVTFQSISMDEQVETDNLTRRRLEWTIIFEVNGWIYPPSSDIKGQIRTVYLDFFSTSKDLNSVGNFESVDSEVSPRDIPINEWDQSKVVESISSDIPIPTEPNPPGPRGEING